MGSRKTSARFISLEGVEGVGKTTNLGFIVDYLEQQGIDVVQAREPGGSVVGEKIRSVLLDPALDMGAEAELLLMFASRAELVRQVIQPALSAGQWVVSDRFADASFAYQGGGRGLGFERVAAIEQWLLADFRPHCTLFLDLAVETGLGRLASRAGKDRIELEQTAFFRQVRDAYLQRVSAEPERFTVIDASLSLDMVQEQIKSVLDLQIDAASA